MDIAMIGLGKMGARMTTRLLRDGHRMEPPVSFEADAIRDEKVKLLGSIRPIAPEDVAAHTVRAQYDTNKAVGDQMKLTSYCRNMVTSGSWAAACTSERFKVIDERNVRSR
ncbi:MAG: NAD(P)-binding domain-containing protein [Chloroflexota bacterium]